MRIGCRKSYVMLVILLATFLLMPWNAFAASPLLNFADLDSGPNSGNTDGVGSGAIVTIWGENLGSTQGSSTVSVGGVVSDHVYYWKNADGTLPGGPADLYTYHKMQEISFSVPPGAPSGATTITVNVNGVTSNSLPFTVRSGSIKFIKSTGSDTSGTGTWSNPYLTINSVMAGGNGQANPGDIVYSVGVGSTAGIKVGGNSSLTGTVANPIALVAYPNTKAPISGLGGDGAVIDNWYPSQRNNVNICFSKLGTITAYGNDPSQATGIQIGQNWKVVGAEITGPTVYGGYCGAIGGSGASSANTGGGRFYGIYIHNYGYKGTKNASYKFSDDDSTWTSPPYNGVGDACTNCTSVDRFQHLYYISNRTSAVMDAYEIAWNYLTDNPILHGIHIYDTGAVGGWNGTIKVHHNVVKNQLGGSIDVAYPVSTPLELHDNLIISDAGTNLTGEPIRVLGGGPIKFYNNTIYGLSMYSFFENTYGVDFRNNIMVDTKGVSFFYSGGAPSTYSNNLFYSTGSTTPPSWYSASNGDVNANPQFTNAAGYDFSLTSPSPALNKGSNTTITTAPVDFLGNTRSSGSVSIGAFGVASSVAPPTGDTTPPTTAISSPAAGATVSGTYSVTATASDNVGVTKVEFYLNGTLKATDTTAPYLFSWDTTTVTNGAYTLTTKAYDAAGNVGQSAAVTVTVNNVASTTPPAVAITSPAANATVSGTVTVAATATDSVGISKVEFYDNGTLCAAVNTAPYSFNWNTASAGNGSHTQVAKAYDTAGNVGQSASVTVTVNNAVADTTAPTTAISAPAAGATVSGSITVTASASDNVGVTKVEFYVDGALKATDTASPYTFTLSTTTLANGAHTLATKAYDAAGNVGQSATVTVTVNNAATTTTTYSFWPATAAPTIKDAGADKSLELGVKFKSDVNGYITGIRFYKSSKNTGTHTGSLWTSSGQLLATATFTNETASGWQQVNFSTPVAIAANTVYVASYHCTTGHYSNDQNFFASKGVDAAPLHALANGVSGPNGLYAFGSSTTFPNQSWLSSNYWVDVVFKQ